LSSAGSSGIARYSPWRCPGGSRKAARDVWLGRKSIARRAAGAGRQVVKSKLRSVGVRKPLASPVALEAGQVLPELPAVETQVPFSPYRVFTRNEWAALRADTPMTLRPDELDVLSGIIEELSVDEVVEIYLPLSRLLNLYV